MNVREVIDSLNAIAAQHNDRLTVVTGDDDEVMAVEFNDDGDWPAVVIE